MTTHQNALLAAGRCGRCAELVSRVGILRGRACPQCDSPLAWGGVGNLVGQLEARQAKWRVLGYALVALTSFLAGAIPLLQVAVQIAAVLVLHLVLLRRELRWLSPARRILTRITIKMLGAAVTCFALTLNVGLAPFPGVASIVLGLAGPILTAAYVEGGLTIIRRRIRAEAEGERVGMGEWFLPTLLATLLVVAVLATVGLVAGTLHLLSTMEIPTVSDVSQRLMELGQ